MLPHDYVAGLLSYDRRVAQVTALSGVYREDSVLRPRFYTVLSRGASWFSVEEEVITDLSDLSLPVEDEEHLLMLELHLVKPPAGTREVNVVADTMNVDDDPFEDPFPSMPMAATDSFTTSTSYTNLMTSMYAPSSPSSPSMGTSSYVYYAPSPPTIGTLGEDDQVECEECGEPRSPVEPCEICGAL